MKNKNVEKYFHGTIYFFRTIGFDYGNKNKTMHIYLMAGIINASVIILGQIGFNIFQEVNLQQRTTNLTYLNYYLVSSAKLIALFYYRGTVNEVLNEFRQLYPSEEVEKTYNLQKYLRQSLMIEKILAIFFEVVTIFYTWSPLVLSVVDLFEGGRFTFKLPYMCWFGLSSPNDSYWSYGVKYLLQAHATWVSAITILGLDLCLFSSLLQLCMHFDVINKNILSIEAAKDKEAMILLKEQVAYHQKLLRLAEKLNTVFTPSVIFSLLSSSLIICFTGFQLLGELTLFIIVKAIFLLAYELKQVAITCFLGDKLIEISLKISDAIYEHNWYNGTPKYRRLVLMVLMRSQHSVALHIAGISDISLQTFRQVMSISYQIFTVLRSG